MTDIRTQNIKNFLSELPGKAFAYLFPGVDKETIDEQSYTYLAEEYPPVMTCHSKCMDIGEADIYDAEPEPHREAIHQQLKRAESTTGYLRKMCYIPRYDLYNDDLKPESQFEEPAVLDLELDEQTKAILAEIETLRRKYKITIDDLEEVLLIYRVKLSRLHITEKKAIVLEDFDRKEVKMDTLTKAVFLLYLRYPEGIRYKELSDYQQELEEIYSSITGREDLDSIRKSVADLCDPLNNSINEKVSKVKKAFRDVVDDHVARFYYIDGKKGTAKRIALDRDFVLWE